MHGGPLKRGTGEGKRAGHRGDRCEAAVYHGNGGAEDVRPVGNRGEAIRGEGVGPALGGALSGITHNELARIDTGDAGVGVAQAEGMSRW